MNSPHECTAITAEEDDLDDPESAEVGAYFTKPHVFVRPSPPEQPTIASLTTETLTRGLPSPLSSTPITPVYLMDGNRPPATSATIYSSLPSFRYAAENSLLTSAVSVLVASLIAVATFALTYYYHGFSVLVSTSIAVFLVWLPVTFSLSASVACRLDYYYYYYYYIILRNTTNLVCKHNTWLRVLLRKCWVTAKLHHRLYVIDPHWIEHTLCK